MQQSRLQASAQLCPPISQIQDINSVSLISTVGSIPKELECRISENCENRDETCCFNGRDTSCMKLKSSIF